MGVSSCLGGMGKLRGDLPAAWICREEVGVKGEGVGRRVAVVEAVVVRAEDVVYSEGVYFEDGIERRGKPSVEYVEAGILRSEVRRARLEWKICV